MDPGVGKKEAQTLKRRDVRASTYSEGRGAFCCRMDGGVRPPRCLGQRGGREGAIINL